MPDNLVETKSFTTGKKQSESAIHSDGSSLIILKKIWADHSCSEPTLHSRTLWIRLSSYSRIFGTTNSTVDVPTEMQLHPQLSKLFFSGSYWYR